MQFSRGKVKIVLSSIYGDAVWYFSCSTYTYLRAAAVYVHFLCVLVHEAPET